MGSPELLHPLRPQNRQLHRPLQINRNQMGKLSPKERYMVNVEPRNRRGLRCKITRDEYKRNRHSFPSERNAMIFWILIIFTRVF